MAGGFCVDGGVCRRAGNRARAGWVVDRVKAGLWVKALRGVEAEKSVGFIGVTGGYRRPRGGKQSVQLSEYLAMVVYFCHPHLPWGKGRVRTPII
jgi:hypothetical protein